MRRLTKPPKPKKRANRQFLEAGKASQWKPGQCGNPGGRPKGLPQLIRDQTGGGLFLVEKMWEIARNAKNLYGPREVMQAIEYLTAYGWGKPPQEVKLDVQSPIAAVNMTVLNNDQLAQLSSALGALKLAEPPPEPPALDAPGGGAPLLEGPGGAGEAKPS